MQRNYFTKNHTTFLLKAHLIFVTKYRKKILIGSFDEFVKNALKEAKTGKFNIEVIETELDHVHMLVNYDPTISISMIQRYLKQMSAFKAWQKYEKLLERHFWKNRTLWSNGYFVTSVGNASIDTIKNYIDNQ